ncbi:MAG: FKBP-type peptidyl-prolyl cis-trans isomerase, partial [Bacteroidota bacterium]
EDAQEFLSSHLQELNTKMAAENLEKVNEFLRENEARQEVTTTASGLQYEVLEMGDGEKPAGDDTIITHYKGTLMDGTLFDSSYDRGYPATFKVNQVIEGWTEALQLMPVGSKWRLYIPPDLAYGENPPQGSNIKPNSLLIFDIELIEIKE